MCVKIICDGEDMITFGEEETSNVRRYDIHDTLKIMAKETQPYINRIQLNKTRDLPSQASD